MPGPNQRLPRLPPPCAPRAYCNFHQNRSSECTKIPDVASRREFRGCGSCNGRHHTSICDRTFTTLPPKANADSKPPSNRFYGANDLQTTLHSSVLAKVNDVQTRIMLYSGTGS